MKPYNKSNLYFYHPVPPRIMTEVCPTTVTCKRYTVCSLCCHATSDSPVEYSWTRNGKKLKNGEIKVINDNLIITPRSAKDYGMYACNAQNSYGSDLREITLIEDMIQEDDGECIYLLIIHLFINNAHKKITRF